METNNIKNRKNRGSESELHILVVDSDKSHILHVKQGLKLGSLTYRLSVAKTFADAVCIIDTDAPDILLAEFKLPDGNGGELLAKYGRFSGFPTIIMTTKPDVATAVKVIRAGAFDCLVKSEEMYAKISDSCIQTLHEWKKIEATPLDKTFLSKESTEPPKNIEDLKDQAAPLNIGLKDIKIAGITLQNSSLSSADIKGLKLEEIINVKEVRDLVDEFSSLVNIPAALIDLEGKVLIKSNWQDICTKFHRVHPETAKNCIESDTILSKGVPPGNFRAYRCKNNMWDIATPIVVGGVHLGNLFLGQIMFDDEKLDYQVFIDQAKKYGFDEAEYIAAMEKVPRLSREKVNTAMKFYTKLVHLISEVSGTNIKLADSLSQRDELLRTIQENEKNLQVALKKFEVLFELFPLGISITNAEGRIIESNAESEKMLEIPKEEHITRSYDDAKFKIIRQDGSVMPSDEYAGVRAQKEGKMIKDVNMGVVKDNGEVVWVSASAVPLPLDGFGVVMAYGDITKRKQTEEALQKANLKLKLLTRITRHDIFNQLMIISTYLKESKESSDLEEVQWFIKNALLAVKRIETITEFTREYEDFGGFLGDWQNLRLITESAKNSILLDKITVENQIPENFEIYSDPIIKKVFTTFFENTHRHGESVSKIQLYLTEQKGSLLIVFEDDGIGIKSDEKKLIFEHGYGKHTGIGLFISREILSITGFSIRECGEYKQGARFEIQVPEGKFRYRS